MRRRAVAVGAIAYVVAASAAAAETPSVSLELGVTAPAPPTLGTADTASQGMVDAEQLQAMPVYRVGELLESVPGLIVTQHSGEGKANQYFLRGFNLDHGTDLAIWLDGMPVNMRTHAHGQGYADVNFLIPELVQSLLVRKGPYWAQDGDFSR